MHIEFSVSFSGAVTRGRLGRITPAALLMLGLLGAGWVRGQGSASDYERARSLRQTTRGKVTNVEFKAIWAPDESALMFSRTPAAEAGEITRLDLLTGEQTPAFDHAAAATLLASEWGSPCDPHLLPIRTMALQDETGTGGGLWLLAQSGEHLTVLATTPDGTVALAGPTAPHPFGLVPLPSAGGKASRDLGGEVHLLFVNQRADAVQLFWVDRQGERRKYGDLAAGGMRRQHTFAGHVWLAADAQGEAIVAFEAGKDPAVATIAEMPRREGQPAETPEEPKPAAVPPTPEGTAPGGHWRAFIRDNNVILENRDSGEQTQLTDDGTPDNSYGGGIDWSPTGTHFVVEQTEAGENHLITLVESTPDDQVQPKLHEFDYRKPGDRIPQSRPRLFAVRPKAVPFNADALIPTPWAVTHAHWAKDGSRFFFVYNQRGHQVLRLVAIDAATGKAATIIEDTAETFIDYSQKLYCHHLDASDEVIWMSERDGWNHLYLIDRGTGAVKRQLTQGQWVVRQVVEVDEEKRVLLARVLGLHPGQDPYYEHYARISLDGGPMTMLTEGDGTHSLEFSPKHGYTVDTYSRVNLPPVKELRRSADGSLVAELTRGDWSALLATGWQPPEPFVAPGRDGTTAIYGVIYRPTTFDPKVSYPVIEAIYAGPHGQHVPKAFADHYGTQELAELGFIVVQIDGMGTNWRSRAFHDVCWKNLGDAGFPDRIAWLRAAAKAYPYMDLTRVGIYGGSAGGQNAMRALIAHHDVYSVAVVDCGCHDNRMDKIWWNEAWMGWPIDTAAYEASSNVVQAHRLEGHLMLTVGELDRNVDPASTMQVVHALIKADKDFDLIVFPGAGHGAGGSTYGVRRMYDFFVRHLHGVEPRWVAATMPTATPELRQP